MNIFQKIIVRMLHRLHKVSLKKMTSREKKLYIIGGLITATGTLLYKYYGLLYGVLVLWGIGLLIIYSNKFKAIVRS